MVKKKLLEAIKDLPNKKQKRIINQTIDIAIQMYQESQLQEDFDMIVDLYQPLKYINFWKKKYIYLCDDNADDFKSEYLMCFVKACQKYKKSKYKKNRYFNKYFFSVITNHFKNKMGKMSCMKRNPSIRCPICEEEVAPLNVHILKEHTELIDEMLSHYDVEDKCPYCSEKLKTIKDKHNHISSKHSSLIYEYFQKLYPQYSTAIQDPAPPIGLIFTGDDDMVADLDSINAKSLYYNEEETAFTHIKDTDVSECQKAILKIFEYYNISKLPSYKKICNMCLEMQNLDKCPRGEKFKLTKTKYENEIEDLAKKYG